MNAEIIAVGSELLLGHILNSNARDISLKLAEKGINVYYHTTVGDNYQRIRAALSVARDRADLIILTGGLGPTKDDLTKETLADFLGAELVEHPATLQSLKAFSEQRKRPLTAAMLKQAQTIAGANVLANHLGTAPGLLYTVHDNTYAILPGPPHEMNHMLEHELLPLIEQQLLADTKQVIHSQVLCFHGIGESMAADRISDILDRQTNPTIAPLCNNSELRLRITALASDIDSAQQLIAPVRTAILNRLGEYCYATEDQSLLETLVEYLQQHGATLAVAESCSGGLLSRQLTSLPGSSAWFLEGNITYNDQAKIRLGVSEQTLQEHGAVSEQTARELALKTRERADSDYSISITGIAGPSGATADKPVGLVYIGVATRSGNIVVRQLNLFGNRNNIQKTAVQTSMYTLIQEIKKGEKIID